MTATTAPQRVNGGIQAARSCAETIEQWHRLHRWAWLTGATPAALSRQDRQYLISETDWRNDQDKEALAEWIEEQAREWPLEISERCTDWHSPDVNLIANEWQLLLCTGGPAVRIVGEFNCAGWPVDPVLEGQDWFTPWEPVSCDAAALGWYVDLFSW